MSLLSLPSSPSLFSPSFPLLSLIIPSPPFPSPPPLVLLPPQLSVTSVTAPEGANNFLESCRDTMNRVELINGAPEWFFPNGSSASNHNVLSLTDIVRTDAGPYECRANLTIFTGGTTILVTTLDIIIECELFFLDKNIFCPI